MVKFLGGPNDYQKEPFANYSFYLEIDGITEAVFREASGIGSTSEVIESRHSTKDGKAIIVKSPGNLKWDDISLKRGFTSDMKLHAWRDLIEAGKVKDARKNGSLTVYSADGTPLAKWSFTNAWPSKLSGPSLNATSNEVAVEEITIVHEGLKREAV
jgi:phage tail-like protein